MRDPYEVLNVSREASSQEIDRAFSQLKERYHPSNYDDSALREIAAEKYREVENAYRAIRKTDNNSGSYGYSQSSNQSTNHDQNRGQGGPFSAYQNMFRQWQNSSRDQWAQSSAQDQFGGNQGSQNNSNQGGYGNNYGRGYGQRPVYYRSSCCSGGCMDMLCAYCVADACCDCLCGSAGGMC